MIQLASKILDPDAAAELAALQAKINQEATFTLKAKKAQTLWNNKGGAKGKKAFETVKQRLTEMTVNANICNYCEQNEANDIEHIFPKSFFPAQTFDWENYILACKQCNSGEKLDKCHVLDHQDNLIFLERDQEPPFPRPAFINIRKEDPNQFMMLTFPSYKFEILPNQSKADQNRATSVLQILELNERDTLLKARMSAARHYYDQLERLAKMLETNTVQQLESLLNPVDNRFDLSKPLSDLKSEIRNSYKNYIQTYQHPSVWLSIKTILRFTNPKWESLFKRVPEAVNW